MIDYFYHVIYGDAAEWSRTVDLNIASNKKFYYVSSHYWPWVNKSNPSKLYFPVIEADEWTQNVGSQVHSLLDVPDHTKDSIFDPKNNYVWTIQLPENGAQVLEPHLYFDISTLALPAEAGFVTEGGTFSSLTSHKFDAISYPGYRFEKWTGSIDSSDSQVTIEALPDQHDITLIANFQKVVPEFNDLSSGWIELENFGPLWSNYEYGGWMFSTKLEWIYVHSLDQNGIWFYSDKLGWNWFSISRTWPYVFNHQTYSWMYYSEESSKKFFHYRINSRINEINFEEIYRQYDIQKNNFFEYSFNSEGKLSVWLVKPFTHTTTSPSGGTIYLGGQSHIRPDESVLEYYSNLVWVPKVQ